MMTQKKRPGQTSFLPDEEIDALPVQVRSVVDDRIPATHPRGTALVATERITKANLEKRLEDAGALVDFYNRAEDLIIRRTKNEDWLLINDKPYPLESAVKKALMTLGVKIHDIRIEEDKIIEQIQGGDFPVIYYTAYGKMIFNGQEVEAVGTATTKDAFFAERSREVTDKDGNVVKEGNYPKKEKYLLKLEDVPIMNVKKKAVTNLYKRGLDLVFRLNPTKEKLEELGITPVSGFQHGKGPGGGATDSAEQKEMRTKIKSLLASLSAATGKAQAEILIEQTKFRDFPGYKSVEHVSPKMLEKTLKALESLAQKAGV